MAALLAGGPVLAACAAGGSGAPADDGPYVAAFPLGGGSPEEREFVLTQTPGPPDHEAFEPSVAWVDDGRYLAVITYGSGSCPSGPHGIDVVADQEIEIRLGPLFPDRDVCSADMSGHVTVVELPPGISPTEPLSARIGDHEVTIPAVVG